MTRSAGPGHPGRLAAAFRLAAGGLALATAAHAAPASAPAVDTAWVRIAPGGGPPAGRQSATMVYDAASARMVLFGGWNGQVNHNDLWALDLPSPGAAVWRELHPEGKPPDGRSEHTAIYDPIGRRMVLFGGWRFGASVVFADLWTLDLTPGAERWDPVLPAGPRPPARYGAGAGYDAANQRMILFGGYTGAGQIGLNDVWTLDLRPGQLEWRELAPGGELPSRRDSFVTTHDPVGGAMLIFGGYDRYHLRLENDGYWLGLTPGAETWRPLVAGPPGPIGRTLSSAVYDAAHRRVLVYAGWWNTTQRLDDLWALELSGSPRWQQLAPLGPGPGARFGHAAAYDGLNQRMVLFSGYIGETDWPDDVWALGEVVPPTATWTSTPTASPTPSATGSPTRDTSPGVPTTPVPTVSTPGSATPTAGTATASPTGGTPDRTPATATQPSGSETSTPIRAYLAFLPRAEVPQPVPPHTPTPTYTPTPECATEEIEPNDTAADADTNPSLCPDVTVRGALPGGDADDLYRLEVTRAAGIEVALWNLPHGTDYDLFLYDAAHQKLAESREFDTTDEVIRLRVPAGRYYARVYAQSGRSAQHYWLRWFAEAGGLR